MMNIEEIILAVFAISNSVRVVAYFPQILKIAKDNDGAAAVSNGTWALFGVSHTSTVAYALVVLGDVYMALLFTANLLCCITIIGLTFWKRRKFDVMRLDHELPSKIVVAVPEMIRPEPYRPVEIAVRKYNQLYAERSYPLLRRCDGA